MSYARTITAIGASGPIEVRNEVYLVDGSTGPAGVTGMLLTLPNIVSDGMAFTFRRIDDGATGTVVTLKGFTNAQTINGMTAITLPSLADTMVDSYNGVWYTIKNIGKGAGAGVPLTFDFTQPNANGIETKSNAWIRAGTFAYNGLSNDPAINTGFAVVYTTNISTYHRVRIFDRTNAQVIAMGPALNTGTLSLPVIVDLGTFSNLPTAQSLFEIQVLATNATGNTGISRRQNIGLFCIQLYG